MSKRRSFLKRALQTIWGISFVLTDFVGAFSLAYWLSQQYDRTHALEWSNYTKQLVTWGLGWFIFGLTMVLVGFLTRGRQIAVWKEIIDAIRRIAKGDFNILIDRDGKYHGQFGAFVRSLNQMASDLKKMEELRQEFISNVSHELQSPLTSIRGFAHTLRDDTHTPEEREHYLAIIEKESERLSKLSDNLLKLTSLESEHQPFRPAPYRLDQQLRSVVLACEPQWLGKELDLELELDETTIVADENLLRQVWNNLVHNAIKFTPQGGGLYVTLAGAGKDVRVTVRDTGIGMSGEERRRIFERFYKGDASRNREAGGSGLGLSIVHKIVELHHGSITVDSVPGEGATFTVVLPAAPPESHQKRS